MKIRRWLDEHSLWKHIAAPIWTRVPERWRWRFVHWLDKNPDRCWADLVTDALADQEEDPCDTPTPSPPPAARPSCAYRCLILGHPQEPHDCTCYCGKNEFIAREGLGWAEHSLRGEPVRSSERPFRIADS